jgi:uncharacterized damage-inducible protein DinB
MDGLDEQIAAAFRDYSCRRLREMAEHVGTCVAKLSDEQVWQRGGEHENAAGNLILHLCGNTRQWILHGVGGQTDVRVRELEFSTRGGMTGAELIAMFRATTAEAMAVIAAVPASRLVERIRPQGRDVTVLDAIYQVVGHVQMHAGQVMLLTKQMTACDLDLTIPRPR